MKKKILIVLLALSLTVSACGAPSAEERDMISTAAAQTVEARFTEMVKNTATPKPTQAKPTATATATPTETPLPGVAPEGCLVANFVSETIPDGTVVKTGEYFTKSWTLLNNGTCTWNKDYKLVYWAGDLIGSAAEYNFFEIAGPGETMTIPIQLRAPDVPGNYTGSWKIKSPSGYIFGVGQYDVPISTSFVASDPGDVEYGITSVVYSLDRVPELGCPTNVHWNINATITVSGRMTVVAQFMKSDGTHEIKETLMFEEAGSKTMTMDWTLYKGAGPAPRWAQLVVFKPEKVYYPTFTFVNNCPDLVD